ncbi:DUF928 domain-containing protein [Cylindrospermum stagnale]|uniref:DUF928 domain-containing protein n=1 Tax=Cylindrospermum stagnale TaxID=142864 RepID=UPI0002EDCDD4|nr:DUF928 domain-containing protein [Cylindrospermum stagnale]
MFILVLGYPSQALAQNGNPFQIALQQLTSLFVPRGKNRGTPTGRVRGGAGRGQCPVIASSDETQLTALVPTISNSLDKEALLSKQKSSQIVWGKTFEAYPTFWFYIPYQYEESELEAKFVLLDEEKSIVTGPIFLKLSNQDNLDQKSKIAKFTLPKQQPLEIGKEYNWYFSIICDARKPSRNPGVTGWIQRVELPILPPKQYLYYAQQGIWYDTVTRLADSRAAIQQAQIDDIAPLSRDKSLITPVSQIQEDWLEVFRLLKWSDEKQINEIANSPILELLPDSGADI